MNSALLAGAIAGLGLFALVRALFPPRPGLATRLAAFDAARRRGTERAGRTSPTRESVGGLRARVGRELVRFAEARGWRMTSIRADLDITDRSLEAFLATKFLLPAAALLFVPVVIAYFALLGLGMSVQVPAWICVIFAVAFFFFPDVQLRQEAVARRNDFRRVVGAFLDLVSMNLAGGRGVPEALMTAANVGDGWAMRRLRDALGNARITGRTPWQALGTLGEDLDVAELRDLAGALALVADDGAQVRKSLAARAASMRSRELSELEGKAGERSQSMLVAQLFLCGAFLVFLAYPAVIRVMGS
ncbi:Bacterial type II secretion system protein F domain protein [Actinomadura rubteroloni]|uniref:Bacterial type II secretion system protein F domain protein n=1 Tax=Actinomadura rubteroloni TaxID=1926885 RepID=A0A2P4UQC9_9ACTN|nr:type II secretion system F family protein [Actinomadura rubteroloni]POM27253.1 Bacterial type II secretion system protein F domain protein [Actinomadura rubteroloni]